MAKPLAFIGCNSAMQLLADAATRQGLIVAGIIDSDYYGNTEEYYGFPIIGSETQFEDDALFNTLSDKYDFFIATNWSPDPVHNRDREKRKYLIDLVERLGITCINLIDPNCYIGSNVKIGQGTYIGYNSYIEFDNQIGSFCIIHSDNGISNGCTIGKNTIIRQRCGLANADIGNNVYIGTCTNMFTSSRRLVVGDSAVVNQGLWVMRSVEPEEHVKLTKDAIRVHRNLTGIA
jgi:carbonic anhydrase/acetyltransferase-like protein (isoleucine patch superfamily)